MAAKTPPSYATVDSPCRGSHEVGGSLCTCVQPRDHAQASLWPPCPSFSFSPVAPCRRRKRRGHCASGPIAPSTETTSLLTNLYLGDVVLDLGHRVEDGRPPTLRPYHTNCTKRCAVGSDNEEGTGEHLWITVTSRLRVHVLPITTMACRALSPMSSCHLAGAGVSVSGAVRRGRVSARAKRRQSHSLMSGTGCRKRGCHHAPTPTHSCLPACLGHDDAAGVIGQHDQREQRWT